MKTSKLSLLLIACTTMAFASVPAFAGDHDHHPAPIDINVGVLTNGVSQNAFASAFANNSAIANATAANGIVSVTDTVDQKVGMNVGIATGNIDQDANAITNSSGYSSATATAANAVASLTASPDSPAVNVGVYTENVAQDVSATATSFTSATAAATAANAIVSINIH